MSAQTEQAAPHLAGVEEIAPRTYRITSEPTAHGLSLGLRRVRDVILGPPLPTSEATKERLNVITGLADLGADNIASTVYGPEEMMRALAFAGVGALALAVPLGLGVVLLLAILALSYRQTIAAYPNGAGGYIVASDNLGPLMGLISAAALLVDYSLDVSVSIASGVQSVTSAMPSLADLRVVLALVALVIITVTNLRGIRTTGLVFAVPVYLYLASTLVMVILGLVRLASGTMPAYQPPPSVAQAGTGPVEALGILLIMRAFSSGAVALTGIEAISNGVPYFTPPEAKHAQTTLILMATSFGVLFLGIAFLASRIGVIPDPTEVETVISQLTRTVLGRGAYYYIVQTATVLMLMLAANTGFADFPRLLSLLSNDRFLPTPFGLRGRRLSFSNGILVAAILAGLLLVVFGGSVDSLVPLFTVGAFGTFTLSQAGMARHWLRERGPRWRLHLFINAFGSLATLVVLGIVAISKFSGGAWMVIVIIPLLVLGLRAIGAHERSADAQTAVDPQAVRAGLLPEQRALRHAILIPVGKIDRVVLFAVDYAQSLATGRAVTGQASIEAVHVTDEGSHARELQEEWQRLGMTVPLVVLESPYRSVPDTLLRYLEVVEQRNPGDRTVVTVLLPEVIPISYWQQVLHNILALRLKWALLFRPRTVVISVPYHLEQ